MNRLTLLLSWLAILLLDLCLLTPPANAQRGRSQGPEYSSMLSTGIAKLGATVNWVVSVDGTEDCKILEVPSVAGLQIQQPSAPQIQQSISMTSQGAYRTTRVSWVLRIRPDAAGDYTIPPLKLSIQGREVFTEELVLKVVLDMRGKELGFFEILAPPTRVYEGEPFTLDMRLGWNADLEVGSARLVLPWWDQLRGVLEIEQARRDLSAVEVAFGLNARNQIRVEEVAPTTRDGQSYRSFRLARRFLASRPGSLDIPESFLEFARLVEDSRPRGFFAQQELEEFYVHLPAFQIEVLAIPEEGRPFEWSGAIGVIGVERRVDRRDLDVGDSLKFVLSWTGDGNLEFFEPPDLARLDAFAGFQVVGTESEYFGDERRVTYDLVPTSSEVTELPAVPLWVFDTRSESYIKVESEPLPIRVRAKSGAGGLEAEGAAREASDIRDILTTPRAGSELGRPGTRAIVGLLFGIPCAWLGLRALVRRRGDPDAPAVRARRRARKCLARDLARAQSAAQQASALARFLAARTAESEQAWSGRDVRTWAESQRPDLAPELVQRLDGMMEQLAARAWQQRAQSGPTLASQEIRTLADALVEGGL